MPNTGMLWVDSVDIEIVGNFVIVMPNSDGVVFKRRMERPAFRKFIEKSRRMLDADDRTRQCEVLEIRAHG